MFTPYTEIKTSLSTFNKKDLLSHPLIKQQRLCLSKLGRDPDQYMVGIICGGLFQKLFKGYIFCFLGHLVGGQLFELFARETTLKKQSSVPLCLQKQTLIFIMAVRVMEF